MARQPDRRTRAPQWSRRTRIADRAAHRLERQLERCEALFDDPDREKDLLSAIADLPSGPFDEPVFHLRIGECLRTAGKLNEAESHYRSALTLDARYADALHGLGLIHQARNELDAMVESWLEVREIDLREPPHAWSIPQDEFTQAAEAALAELPEQTRRHFSNLAILATDYPTAELIQDGIDPRSLGIISGVPYSEKQGMFGMVSDMDCIQLYQRNIERIATSREEVLEEIRITVLHETGHYFGLSDADLEDIGLG
jgi:predicted Zn-dependent protease with MMP-like domain